MIIIWNTNKLKENLAEKTISDFHAFIYFVVILIYDHAAFTLAYLGMKGEELSVYGKINIVSALGLTLLGVLYVFWRNGGIKGEQFFHRYFSLSVVVGIKFAILMLALPTLIDVVSDGKAYELFPPLGSVLFIVLNCLMFAFIGRHVHQLANA
jgi:hypothetical protein